MEDVLRLLVHLLMVDSPIDACPEMQYTLFNGFLRQGCEGISR
jgi:hypothetical protein